MSTKLIRGIAVLLLAPGASLQSHTVAVAQGKDAAILHTITAHLREQLPSQPTVLDPRILSPNVFHGPSQGVGRRESAVTRALGGALGGPIYTLDELWVYEETIQGVTPCHLAPVERLVILSAPEIRQDTATVRVSIRTNQELLHSGFEGRKNAKVMDLLVTLTRTKGMWKVTTEEVLRMS